MSIVSQVTRKTKPEIKQELQDWNYNFFEDFAMLGAPEKVAYNFKTLLFFHEIPGRKQNKVWKNQKRVSKGNKWYTAMPVRNGNLTK